MDTLWSILIVALIALGAIVVDSYLGISMMFAAA